MILEGEIKDGKMREQFFIWFSNTHETLVRFDSNTGKSVENKDAQWCIFDELRDIWYCGEILPGMFSITSRKKTDFGKRKLTMEI